MRRRWVVVLLGALLLAAGDGRADPRPRRRDTATFARQARRIHVGASRKRVRRLLGEPEAESGGVWSYRNPPDRPDGPYQTFHFTFVSGRVSKIEEGGVACIYRERRD